MKVPEMTPLQFLVVHLLFQGEKTGPQLHQLLDERLGTRTAAAFSQLMTRMVFDAYVEPHYRTHLVHGQTVRERTYRVTDLGLALWNATRRFYNSFDPPPPDLQAAPAQETQFAHHPPKQRKALLKRQFTRRLLKSFRHLLQR